MKAITYGQLRDALDSLIKSRARKANDPLYLNGNYWVSIVDCKSKTGQKGRSGSALTEHKVIARGKVKVRPMATLADRIKLV